MNRKYLQISILNGRLYVYADNTAWKGHKTMRLKDLDNECCLCKIDSKESHFKIPLKDFTG